MKGFKSVSHSAGGIVVNKKSRVCLIRDKNLDYLDNWFIPKGRIENEECPLETAKREILEETGLKKIKLVKKLGMIKRPNVVIPDQLKVIDVFLFTTSQEELKPQESQKDAKWFEMNDVTSKLYSKKEKDFFKEHRDEMNET